MATTLMLDRTSTRQLAATLAFVMMIASLPSIGVIVISDRSGPTIAMDICHPLQSFDQAPSTVAIARPAQLEIGGRILSDEAPVQLVPILKSKLTKAPDPPPPKLLS